MKNIKEEKDMKAQRKKKKTIQKMTIVMLMAFLLIIAAGAYVKKEMIWKPGYPIFNRIEQNKIALANAKDSESNKSSIPARNTVLTSNARKCNIRVISSDANPTAAYVKSLDKKSGKIVIPNTVKIQNVTYRITSIDMSAFRGNNHINKVTIGKYVTSIKNNAFGDCKALKLIVVKSSKLSQDSIANNVWKGTLGNITVLAPKNKVKEYRNFFSKKGNAAMSVYRQPDSETLRNGWSEREGKLLYYQNGKRVMGFQKLDHTGTYYFNKNGILQVSSWIKKNGKKYRANYRGTLIKGKNCTIDKNVYYFNTLGELQGYKAKGSYYNANDKQMSQSEQIVFKADITTLKRAKKIVAQITNDTMSKQEKLKKCFDWVISKPYATRRAFNNAKGWPAEYANDHFVSGRGNCFSDAAAFAYMAKALGYTDVYLCVDTNYDWANAHGWAQIGGLAYDPLFAESKNYKKNFGAKYGVYSLTPMMRVAL